MECPKCGAEIDKNAMVCPNCKKVLKIVCPVCRTVNTKNVCRKCGEILVTKCSKCGKINLMKNPKCVKCGYSNEISAVQGESNSDSFAVVRIDFPNSDVVKAKLGSNQLYQKFRTNFDAMIASYVSTLRVRRQIIKNDIYIIRFNRDYTFTSSANSAILATIELLNMITKLNVKLLKKKGVALRCNFSIMKRDADKNPYDIDSKFHANMVYQSSSKDMKALDAFQVITDEDFYDSYKDKYKMESLNSTLVDGAMKRFYEIDLKEFVNIGEFLRNEAQQEQESHEDLEIPNFVQSALIDQEKITQQALKEENQLSDDEIYDIEMINFEEINCAFIKTESINVLDCVVQTLQQVPKGVLAIKASPMYQPYSLKLLSAVEEIGIYDNVIPVTCHDDMKYSPYAFFRDLVSSIFDYTVSQKLFDTNDFSMFANIDKSKLIEDLVRLNQRPMQNMEQTREDYCNVFLSLLKAIPNTLIFIENYEKMDSSSMFVLEKLFDYFDETNISYLISYDKEFSLHKNAHFLLARPYYTEVTLTPTPFEIIIGSDLDFYKNIMTDFYFQRIAKYACGSTLFLDFAIQYLIESGVYEYTEDSIVMVNPKTIIIPSGLDKLIKRRINLMKDDEEMIKFLTMLVLLGTRVDEKTINSLGFNNWQKMAEKLSGMGYMYTYNNCLYFPNYNILRKCLLEVIKPEYLQSVANELFENVFIESMPAPVKTFLFDKLQMGEQVIFEWEKLANTNLSMGDFASYLNCSHEILTALDKYAQNWSEEDLMKFKFSLYENVSNNLFDYDPEKTRELAEKTLLSIQRSGNSEQYVSLCTRMIQGSIEHGDYMYAMNLTHGVLSSLDKSSIDPSSPDFNLYFLLMSIIYVKILFNIGAYEDCLDIGYNVLNVLDSEKIDSIQYTIVSKEEFKYLVSECVGYIALVDVITLKEDVGEFLDISKKLLNFLPDSYSIFVQLQNLIKGQSVNLDKSMDGEDVFSPILYHIINAFISFKNNPEKFAQEIYKSKLIAKNAMMLQFELFSDLMIGYAYIGLNSFKKASAIIYKIIKDAKFKGMNAIVHSAWYVMSILNIKEGKYDIAYGVLNNSDIQMEKNGVVSDYLTMLNKVNMYKILMCTDSKDQAQICMNQASTIVQKYGLNFNLNIDIQKIMMENSVSTAEQNKAQNTVKKQDESISVEENLSEFSENDGDVVNPSEFFSD